MMQHGTFSPKPAMIRGSRFAAPALPMRTVGALFIGCSGRSVPLIHPALNVVVDSAHALQRAQVVFFAPVAFYPHANLRHDRFLNQAISEVASGLSRKNIGLVLQPLERPLDRDWRRK
jgi:hypothetical protein